MAALETLPEIKPFCPVHHWRMAVESGSPEGSVFRCNYDQCQVRYHAEEGYFEAGRLAGNRMFLLQIENVECPKYRDHHPRIVSYTKDSSGEHSEEWRYWQCHSHGCDFSHRQRLTSPAIPVKRKEQVTADRALATLGNYTLAIR